MKRILIVISCFFCLNLSVSTVYADHCNDIFHASFEGNKQPPSSFKYGENNLISVSLTGLYPGNYYINVLTNNLPKETRISNQAIGSPDDNGNLTFDITDPQAFLPAKDFAISDFVIQLGKINGELCDNLWTYKVQVSGTCNISFIYHYNNANNPSATGDYSNASCIETFDRHKQSVDINVNNVIFNGKPYSGTISIGSQNQWSQFASNISVSNGNTDTINVGIMEAGTTEFAVYYNGKAVNNSRKLIMLCHTGSFSTDTYCTIDRLKTPASSGNLPGNNTPIFNLCKNLEGKQKDLCDSCLGTGNGGVWTALGCIRTNPKDFISDFLKIALGVAGGIALLLMIYGAFLVSVSTGDPKKADEGKEVITGAIAGLLFIIFSVFLLKLIGVDILQIPGF